MNTFTAEEMKARLILVQKILLASRSIRNLPPLEGAKLQEAVEAWEAAFAGVATKQLPDLYRIGLRHKCTTAAEFQAVWEMQANAEAEAKAHAKTLAKRAALEKVPVNIPQFILDNWGVAQ